MSAEDRWLERLWTGEVIASLSVTAALIAAETAAILLWNDGTFLYTLDDPYIHFALAENIVDGHYGVNSGEPSAPSSSILWPVFLAPLVPTLGSFAALLLNVPAALVTAGVLGHVASFLRADDAHASAPTVVLAIVLVIATNTVGLVFTGMEHSLQVLLSVLTALGLYRTVHDDAPAPWWLWGVIVVAPLIRYENAALSVPALAVLAVPERRRAGLAGILLAGLLGGYSLFLHDLGLSLLPTSVLAKTSLSGAWWSLLPQRLFRMVLNPRGLLLSLCFVGFAGFLLADRRSGPRRYAAWGATMIGLHALFGRFGWFYRYEVYVWAAALVALLLLYHDSIESFVRRAGTTASVSVLVMLGMVTGAHYTKALLDTPQASHEIYLQQYQMHRFLTEHYRAPVAVNDLGWTSYRNDHYVLDLTGLANLRSLRLRRNGATEWRRNAVRPYADSVQAALLYANPGRRDLPPEWTPVAALKFEWTPVAVAHNSVFFYAMDPSAATDLRRALRAFRPTLPPDATLQLLRD